MNKQYNVLINKESLLNEIESMFINEDFINIDKYDAKSMLIRISELIDNVKLVDDNDARFGSIEERLYMLEPLKKEVKSIKAKHKNDYDDLDNKYNSLDRSIDNALLPIDDLKKEVKSIKANQKNDYNTLFNYYDSLNDEIKNNSIIKDVVNPLIKEIDSIKDNMKTNRKIDIDMVVGLIEKEREYLIDLLKVGNESTNQRIKSLKSDIKSLNVFIFDEEGFPHHKSLRDDVNSINKLLGNHEIDIKSINDNIETFNDIKCDIKDINDDIKDIKCDLEYKIHEDDLDDKINDSDAINDIESKLNELDDYSNNMVELTYVESIDARLKRIENTLIGRVINSVKGVFNRLKSVRISIKTK